MFNYLEVETPAKALNFPDQPIPVGFDGYTSVGFVVDTNGRPEMESLQFGEFDDQRTRATGTRIISDLRFTPAEHHAGCRVRQGMGVDLEFK